MIMRDQSFVGGRFKGTFRPYDRSRSKINSQKHEICSTKYPTIHTNLHLSMKCTLKNKYK